MGIQDRDYYRDKFNKKVDQHDRSPRRPPRSPNRRPPSGDKIPRSTITILCIFVVAISLHIYNNRSKAHVQGQHKEITNIFKRVSTPKIPQLIPPTEPLLQEKEPPQNGAYKFYYPPETYVAPLTLVADSLNHYVVKLIDASKRPVLYIFVRANDTVKTKAPLGIYEIQWVSGKKWYGDEHLFGNSSSYKKGMQNLVFHEETTEKGTRKIGHIIRFNTVMSGMPSEKISGNEFSNQ